MRSVPVGLLSSTYLQKKVSFYKTSNPERYSHICISELHSTLCFSPYIEPLSPPYFKKWAFQIHASVSKNLHSPFALNFFSVLFFPQANPAGGILAEYFTWISNLCQLLCNGFCGFFSNFPCQESSLLEGMSRALAVCGGRELACPWCFTSSVWARCSHGACRWCFTSSVWAMCYLLPDASLPWHAGLCWRNPGFHFIVFCRLSQSSHTHHCREVSQPRAVAAVETWGSFPTSRAGFRPSRARAWPATRSMSGTGLFNFSHSRSLRQRLSCLCLPSFPELRKREDSIYPVRDET